LKGTFTLTQRPCICLQLRPRQCVAAASLPASARPWRLWTLGALWLQLGQSRCRMKSDFQRGSEKRWLLEWEDGNSWNNVQQCAVETCVDILPHCLGPGPAYSKNTAEKSSKHHHIDSEHHDAFLTKHIMLLCNVLFHNTYYLIDNIKIVG
jgi:hypothetical protein